MNALDMKMPAEPRLMLGRNCLAIEAADAKARMSIITKGENFRYY